MICVLFIERSYRLCIERSYRSFIARSYRSFIERSHIIYSALLQIIHGALLQIIYRALLQIISDRQLRFSISETWAGFGKRWCWRFRVKSVRSVSVLLLPVQTWQGEETELCQLSRVQLDAKMSMGRTCEKPRQHWCTYFIGNIFGFWRRIFDKLICNFDSELMFAASECKRQSCNLNIIGCLKNKKPTMPLITLLYFL
jgi:hypothetical protein